MVSAVPVVAMPMVTMAMVSVMSTVEIVVTGDIVVVVSMRHQARAVVVVVRAMRMMAAVIRPVLAVDAGGRTVPVTIRRPVTAVVTAVPVAGRPKLDAEAASLGFRLGCVADSDNCETETWNRQPSKCA